LGIKLFNVATLGRVATGTRRRKNQAKCQPGGQPKLHAEISDVLGPVWFLLLQEIARHKSGKQLASPVSMLGMTASRLFPCFS
jgi:hypothetical protein